MYSFYATLATNSKVIIHNYQELDLPCATRKSEVGLPIYNLQFTVLCTEKQTSHKCSNIFLIFENCELI